jgi:predicted nucleotidyltransferase
MEVNIFEEGVTWETTDFSNPYINEIISSHLKEICRIILKKIPKVKSIYITGGFSRGEGCISIINDEIKIFSDYDVLVVTEIPQFFIKKKIFKIEEELSKNLANIDFRIGHPVVEIALMKKKSLKNLKPSMFNYDLGTAKLLYGEEINIKKIEPTQIPKIEGLRLLFNRIVGLLLQSPIELKKSNYSSEMQRYAAFEVAKQIIGCCEAIIILNKKYFPFQKQKINYLKENAPRFIKEEILELLDLGEEALNYRLRYKKDFEKDISIKWFKARDITLKVVQYYFNEIFKINESNWDEIVSSFLTKNPHPVGQNIRFVYANWGKDLNYLKCFFGEPINAILGALLYLMASIDNESGFNHNLLYTTKRLIFEYIPLKMTFNNDEDLWYYLKKKACEYYIDPYCPAFLNSPKIYQALEASK